MLYFDQGLYYFFTMITTLKGTLEMYVAILKKTIMIYIFEKYWGKFTCIEQVR